MLRTVEGRRVNIGESSEEQNFSFPALRVSEFEFDEGDTSIGHDDHPPALKEVSVVHEICLHGLKDRILVHVLFRWWMVCRLVDRVEGILCKTVAERQ